MLRISIDFILLAVQNRPMDLDSEAVILEFVRLGPVMRVSAMEPGTLTEVVIQGPASAGEAELRRVALRKLAWVLERHERARGRRGSGVAS